jgi:hypothetical protein
LTNMTTWQDLNVKVSNHSMVQCSGPSGASRRVRRCTAGHFRKAYLCRFSAHSPGIQWHRRSSRTCFEGPFGELLRATGPMAKANPFRFSTKWGSEQTFSTFRCGELTAPPWGDNLGPGLWLVQGVDWSGVPCKARFWDWKLGPAKPHYLWGSASSEEPHI